MSSKRKPNTQREEDELESITEQMGQMTTLHGEEDYKVLMQMYNSKAVDLALLERVVDIFNTLVRFIDFGDFQPIKRDIEQFLSNTTRNPAMAYFDAKDIVVQIVRIVESDGESQSQSAKRQKSAISTPEYPDTDDITKKLISMKISPSNLKMWESSDSVDSVDSELSDVDSVDSVDSELSEVDSVYSELSDVDSDSVATNDLEFVNSTLSQPYVYDSESDSESDASNTINTMDSDFTNPNIK